MKNLTKLRKILKKESATYCTLAEFKKVFGVESTEQINKVFMDLKERIENPCGAFDSAGRFYLDESLSDLSTSRSPSRAYPFPEMQEGRTRKFIMKVFINRNCKSLEELQGFCFS